MNLSRNEALSPRLDFSRRARGQANLALLGRNPLPTIPARSTPHHGILGNRTRVDDIELGVPAAAAPKAAGILWLTE
jgi:hypothetical protein